MDVEKRTEMNIYELFDPLNEKWSKKYKHSIDCSHPKGFSQRAHCAGRKKHNEDASGVVATKAQAHDPRYSMSLTKDVRPGEIERQLKKYSLAESADTVAYDRILVELCEGILAHQKQDAERYGLVAAAVVDPDMNVVYGINHLLANGRRVHGERAAIENYRNKHGELPEDCIIVTTLSPCTEEMAEREGISCTELIDSTPVRAVYCGYRDPSQSHVEHEDFDIRFTQNHDIERMCKSIADCFLPKQLHESVDAESAADDFVPYVVKRLGIDKLPDIQLKQQIGTSEHPTFGLFDPETNSVQVATGGRHIMDVLRTLAHELVHHKQRENNMIQPGDGATGSRVENQANAVAGVLMRDFADQHPDYFGALNELKDPPEQKKSWDDYSQPAGPKLEPKEKVYHNWQHYDDETNKKEPQQNENFADGKNPGRKGLSKRMGVNTKASVSSLRNTAKHSTGEKARMAHWLANMKAGRAKHNK
jgi:pyrimidine deaminase RibD-like protein